MRTTVALTLLVSGLIIRVCFNLHHFLEQPFSNKELVADKEHSLTSPVGKELPSYEKTEPFPTMPADNPRQIQTVYAEAKFSEHCQQGDIHSCEQDFLQKKKWCEEGNLIDCNSLAWMYLQGAAGIKSDPAQAIALFENACERGGRVACSSLGQIYKEGKGVAKDDSKAIEYWKKNCSAHNSTNCYELALMYYEGKGTLTDKEHVVPLMLQSCDGNRLHACKWLAENNTVEASHLNTAALSLK